MASGYFNAFEHARVASRLSFVSDKNRIKDAAKETNKFTTSHCEGFMRLTTLFLLIAKFGEVVSNLYNDIVSTYGEQYKEEIKIQKCKTKTEQIVHVKCLSTKGDGSCGWRSILTIIMKEICGQNIPKDYVDFYKYIVLFKLSYYAFIRLIINSSNMEMSDVLSGLSGFGKKYVSLDEYFTDLMMYDYQLTLYEIELVIRFLHNVYDGDTFKCINVLLCCSNTKSKIYRLLCSTCRDIPSPIELLNYPTILLYNGHWEPVVNLKECEVITHIEPLICQTILHKLNLLKLK